MEPARRRGPLALGCLGGRIEDEAMATTHLQNPIPSQGIPAAAPSVHRGLRAHLTPTVVGASAFTATVVGVLVLATLSILWLTDVSVLAAVGFGLYCAFWLGIGFGTIVASALVFGHGS